MPRQTPLVPMPTASRRHHLAILFCDLVNSTGIAASMEPELYAELLQHLRNLLTETVARHGGEIARIDGDGALCIFGYPNSHEDAGRRATEAAIDLHAGAAELDRHLASGAVPFRLHSGIHAGVVLLRDGDIVRGRFEILGDATNVAARLCDLAGSDEIIVSESTLGADRYFFRSGPPRLAQVAGHAQALAILNIYGREPVTSRYVARARRGVTPFAGRAAEMAQLRAWLADPEAGPMLVSGPPGIGKSRLLAEFLAEATAGGVAVHRGYCEAYLGARPLQPFTHLVRSITADPAAEISDPAFPASGDSPSGPGTERTVEVIHALTENTKAGGQCIFAIDDWQWADGASRDVLESLAVASTQVRFLLASRGADARLLAAAAARRIEIPPLSPPETQAAIAALLATPDPFLARRIADASGGSPLFLEELCHASMRGVGAPGDLDRHAWLDMLIQARFGQLSAEQADLLRAASVIGHMVPAWLFTATTGVKCDDPGIAELAEADFLFPGDVGATLRFKHGITRDAVYRAIGLKERHALHKKVVLALEAEAARSGEEPLLDALAYHHAASGDGERAVPYAIRAGDSALAAGALDRAQEHYRAAFEIVALQGTDGPLAEQVWPLFNKYGLACIVDPSPDQLLVMREMARRLEALGNAKARVRSEYWIGLIAYGLGEARQSVAHLTAALQSANDVAQSSFAPQIQAKLAQSLFAAGRYEEADALFEDVLGAISREESNVGADAYAYALCCHGFLHADRGDFAAAGRRYAEADSVLDSAGPAVTAACLTQKSAVCLYRGEWAGADSHAQHCLELCGVTHARYHTIMANTLGAYARWHLDGDASAIEILEGAVRWFDSGASRQRTSLVYGWLADIMAETGRSDLARSYAARAIERVHRAGDRLGEAMAYRAVARLAAAAGRARQADRYLAAAYRSAAIRGSPREEAQTRLCEAKIALAAGDRARAEPMLDSARAAFAEMGMAFFTDQSGALLAASR